MSDDTVRDGSNGRAKGGLFAKGNKFATGNPQAKRAYELRQAILDANGPDILAAVSIRLGVLALEGDVAAARLLLEYTVGRPAQAIELTGAEGEPLGADWGRIESAILAALAPFGDGARFQVALALRGIVDAGRAESAES